ncbi:MAG: hypothetical protein JNJ89_01690 [Rubrivivax sp.]|nr:hypothetical protein [Rubrivivax sp.]
MRSLQRVLLLAGAAWLAAACGGNAGSDEPAPAPPPSAPSPCDTPGTTYASFVKAAVLSAGQGGGAAIAGCTGAIESPQWTQTGGPAVELLSAKSQTLHFETSTGGRYSFRASFRDATGAARTEDVVVEFAPLGLGTRLALRANQSVRMGGNVSVRAWPALAAGDSVASITWAQLEGPAVTLDTSDPYVALFVAPQVSRDTPVRLRATLTTLTGQTASDDVLVLVERHTQAAASDAAALWAGDHVSRVYAYRPAGPYAAVLQRCVYDSGLRDNGTTSTLCPLSQLPFLAQEVGTALPSIEQVMNRVIVSHDWAGRNFETFLQQHDAQGDFRRMLKSVTAIVIGTQVRPSFYYPATGAIYLDADNFWLTPEERDTVNEAPDFRSGFGQTLQYTTLWRYVSGSESIFRFYDPRQRVPRFDTALVEEAGWLMFHELGHALDFLPPSVYGTLNSARTAWGNIELRYSGAQLASDTVPALYPLTSSVMSGLGQVRFFGATANATQSAYTPQQVAAFFAADLATDDYAYASKREDIAMTLEEFLMARRLGYRRDFAVTARPGPGATGSTILVAWGQRGRIGEPTLRPRLRAVVQQLAPWIDPADVDLLPPPLPMRVGDSWTGNLRLPAPPTSPRLHKTEPTLEDLWLLERAERRRQRLQPLGRALPRFGAGAPVAMQ